MKLAKFAFSFLVICLLANQFYAQKNDEPFRVRVNLLVLDENDQYIDVNQADVKIFEDGVEQQITYFAKKEPVLNLAMVFDNSGSVRKKLDEITNCGKTIAANLRDNDEAVVIRFVSSDKVEVVQDFTNNKGAIKEAIDNLYVEGGQTAVLDAVYLSAEKLMEKEKNNKDNRYAILLFSDGEDRDSFYKTNEVLMKFIGTDIQIFFVSYALTAPEQSESATKLTHALSLSTGGTVYLIPRKKKDTDLIVALKLIVSELRSQYVVGYLTSNPKRDNKPRKLSVQITNNEKGEERKGFVREGFTVPKK